MVAFIYKSTVNGTSSYMMYVVQAVVSGWQLTARPCSTCMSQIQFRGDGPLSGILAVADTKGQVKGKVGNPAADPPLRPDGKLAVGAAVGQGQLCVTRSHPRQPQPFTGVVSIVSGEVAEDLATYLVSLS